MVELSFHASSRSTRWCIENCIVPMCMVDHCQIINNEPWTKISDHSHLIELCTFLCRICNMTIIFCYMMTIPMDKEFNLSIQNLIQISTVEITVEIETSGFRFPGKCEFSQHWWSCFCLRFMMKNKWSYVIYMLHLHRALCNIHFRIIREAHCIIDVYLTQRSPLSWCDVSARQNNENWVNL